MNDLIGRHERDKQPKREVTSTSGERQIYIMPKDPCEDAISRQASIDAIESYKDFWKHSAFLQGLDKAIDEVRNLPSVTPARPKGEWTFHYSDEDGLPDGCECSECKNYYFFGGNNPNFCPNCGADMRGDGA